MGVNRQILDLEERIDSLEDKTEFIEKVLEAPSEEGIINFLNVLKEYVDRGIRYTDELAYSDIELKKTKKTLEIAKQFITDKGYSDEFNFVCNVEMGHLPSSKKWYREVYKEIADNDEELRKYEHIWKNNKEE